MRAIQLRDYWTGQPAPEADRIRIQSKIDELGAEIKTSPSETERQALSHRIAILRGGLPPLRG